MQHIAMGILGDGFFPGARGNTEAMHRAGGIMLLGQDFGTTKYCESKAGEHDEYCTTWTNTCDCYLKRLGRQVVWCTNYLMGARRPPLSAQGDLFDLIKDEKQWRDYEEDCWRFLCAQVDYQRPELIVVLGNPNRERLSGGHRLNTGWGDSKSISEAIRNMASVNRRFSFPLDNGEVHTTALSLAFHPCYGQGIANKMLIDRDAERVADYHKTLTRLS